MASTVIQFGGHAVVTLEQGTVPTDADFVETPPDGTVVVAHDATANAGAGGDFIYVRTNGVWKRVGVS